MDGFRHHGRPVYVTATPETYAYQNLYGTVRGNPHGKVRPSLDLDHPMPTNGKSKKSFNFLPWKKNKSKTDDSVIQQGYGTLSKHNKYKFGSVSALSSAGLYRDWDSSLSYTPSYSSTDLKHASVKSAAPKVRGLVIHPWETYKSNNDVDARNFKNNHMNTIDRNNATITSRTKALSIEDVPSVGGTMCKCQKKKSGPFGTMNLNSLKSTKCNCGFSSVRSSRGFAPPPPPRRRSILPEKVELYAVHEDQVQLDPKFGGNRRKHENIYDTLSRHGKYKAPAPPVSVGYTAKPTPTPTKLIKSLEKCKKDPYSSVASRKSILECDVTAYDLVKNYLKSDSNGIDSDLDDDLSDNIIEGKNKTDGTSDVKLSPKKDSYKSTKSSSPVSSESESGIYSQASSMRIGGHGMKVMPNENPSQTPSLYSEGSKTNSVDSRTSSWSTSSLSDDGIYSLPEPDYDDEDYKASDRYGERIYSSPSQNLRKYPSGGYLDRSDCSSRNSMAQDALYESPRFSTIRKATSMVSLASGLGEHGTLRGRVKPPCIPEVPVIPSTTAPPSAPPPPPPPPPPPNFSLKSTPQKESPPVESPKKPTMKTFTSPFGSSIASELTEKLKSNQPILKKTEAAKKQPVNSHHNPYAEVKSILKKTGGERASPTSVASSGSPDALAGSNKKRVQFKSLSNESLAVEQIQHPLSSSDEEWEEARESFGSDDKKEMDKVEKEDKGSPAKKNGDKPEPKGSTKVSTIPRPTQPPPPPPNIRNKSGGKGPPPPRPLSSAPKSFSHSDLRVTSPTRPAPGLVKISAKNAPMRPGQQAPILNSNGSRIQRFQTGTKSSAADSPTPTSNIPKNGVSSPAASLEAIDASSRGKSTSEPTTTTTTPPLAIPTTVPSPTPPMDDDSSESSYMSLPYDGTTMDEDDVGGGMKTIRETDERDEGQSREDGDGCSEKGVTDDSSLLLVQKRLLPEGGHLERRIPDGSSSEDDTLCGPIEGPLYSNLIYVSRKSPSPPPLPTTLPPLPPKRSPVTRLSFLGTQPYSSDDDDSLYDVLPARTVPKAADIYECRRYSDTGAVVVTIPLGYQEPLYNTVGSEVIYEELPGEGMGKDDEEQVSSNPFGSHRRSFFEGASKADILKFLERAKERVVDHLEDDILDDDGEEISRTKNVRNNPIRISNISSSSESSTISSVSSGSLSGSSNEELSSTKVGCKGEVERADSGVGSETSKPAVTVRRPRQPDAEELCADCDQRLAVDATSPCCPLVCAKCDKKRAERKEIVTEIVDTEFKYGKDLRIIKEELKVPMEVAGLLTKEQLSGVFLNLDELMLVNGFFAEKLKDATDIAAEQGDEDYTTVNIGKIFLETTTMLRAFEVYCIRQGTASVLLTNMEKEKELLRIFLRVSQMENPLLRRMNLSAFLMVPVQRVTKYPLLLNRLYKVTPYHHKDRESLREAQLKIELHLEHINQQTKGITGTKIWRRISNISANHRRSANISDIGSIQLRKMAIEVLEWSKEDIRFVMAGRLSFSGAVDFTKSRRGRALKFTSSHALLATKGRPNSLYRPDLAQENSILFPRNSGIEDATLLLVKEKNGRYSLARDPLHLGSCIISAELEDEDIIEIQEYTTKESIFLKAECHSDTTEWLKQLRYHAKDLGTWKRRRNALANIMINGMIRPQQQQH